MRWVVLALHCLAGGAMFSGGGRVPVRGHANQQVLGNSGNKREWVAASVQSSHICIKHLRMNYLRACSVLQQ